MRKTAFSFSFAPHRLWMAGLACALFVLFAAPMAGDARRAGLEDAIAARTIRIKQLSAQIRQWNEDAEKARELSESLKGKNLESYLAPMNRAALAAQLAPLAARARLSNVAYTLGPEEKAGNDPSFPNAEGLSQSRLTIEADAALDTDVFAFLESLSSLPGRMDTERLNLKREKGNLGLRNIKLRADLLWLSNASERKETP